MIRCLCSLFCLMAFLEVAVPLPTSTGISNYRSLQVRNASTTSETKPAVQNEGTNPISITQSNNTADYPVVTKYEPQYIQEQTEPDEMSIEELKSKCQHLQKLLNLNKTHENTNNRPANHHYPEMHARPIYVNPRPSPRPQHSSTPRPQGFYITATQTTPTPIKYIRLEPVILQKTILSDGRMVYYWHKSLPTAVEYPANYTPSVQYQYQEAETVGQQATQNMYGYAPQSVYPSHPNGYYYPSYSQNFNAGSNSVEATTEPTTTTTEASYGYGLSNFIPFYGYGSGDVAPSTTTSEATVSTTPASQNTPEPLLYAQQLRFVIPVPYDGNSDDSQRRPYGFDQYAYYPKQLQPNSVNVRIPYSPTFHMIKAIAVPKVEGESSRTVDEIN